MTAPKHTTIRDNLPLPHSPEGLCFIYTPEETSLFVPLSPRTLRDMATAREIPRASGANRPTRFSGQNICDINRAIAIEAEPDEHHGRSRNTSAA